MTLQLQPLVPDFDLDASLAPNTVESLPVAQGAAAETFSPTRWERLIQRWFPNTARKPEQLRNFETNRWLSHLEPTLHIHATTRFSWPDRLRILVSGEVKTVIYVATSNPVGEHLVQVQAYPLPPRSWKTAGES